MIHWLQNQPTPPKTIWDTLHELVQRPNGLYYLAGIFLVVLAYRLDTIGHVLQSAIDARKAALAHTASTPNASGGPYNGRLTMVLQMLAREQRLNELATLNMDAARQRLESQDALVRHLQTRLALAEAQLMAYNASEKKEEHHE